MQKINYRDKRKELDVEIISHDIAFKGYFQIEKYQLRYKLFEGGWSDVITREVFERGQAAAVLPYDPIQDKVVLIEQFRVGALTDEKSPWLLEIVAGILNSKETHEQVAYRETQEEAGLDIIELTPITKYWVSPGGSTEGCALFCGKIDANKAGGIHGLDEESEDICVHVFDVQEAFDMVRRGIINNAPAIITLQWLELNKQSIFKF